MKKKSIKQIKKRMAQLDDIIDNAQKEGNNSALFAAALEALVLEQMLAVASIEQS